MGFPFQVWIFAGDTTQKCDQKSGIKKLALEKIISRRNLCPLKLSVY